MMIVASLLTVQALAFRPPPLHRRHVLPGATATALSLRSPSPAAAFTQADYEKDPADISAAVLPKFKQKEVFLHFHGRGGPDREDADLKARILKQDQASGLDRFVHVFV